MAPPTSSISFRFLVSSSFLLSLLLSSLKEGHAISRRKAAETYHHTLQTSSLFPASVCNPTAAKGSNRKSSVQVVHRHGPCNQHKVNDDAPTITQILSQDESRVHSIHSRLAFNSGKAGLQGDSKANLPAKSGSSLGTGNYIVTVGLGYPKKDISLIFDTGSDFTWTQCLPCARSCYEQQDPIFDPSKSTTYSNITCSSALCSQVSSATGSQTGCSTATCVYGIRYGDSSFSIGYFGKEKLTLTPTDVFDEFYFGCGQNNRGLFGRAAGLLGLGRDPLSIVSQTSQKYGKYFSYCLPTKSGSNGHLSFGNNGVPNNVQYTPFASNSQGTSFYFIEITGISVGGKQLSINPSVFKAGGTIIDSGTVITRLQPDAYNALSSAFSQQMNKYTSVPGVSILDTCYDLSNYTTVTIPKISFLFNGNVKVDIAAIGTLYAVKPTQVCLAFAGNSDSSDVGIFGNVQQQTLEVVHNVAGGKLGFAAGGCA